VGRPLGPGPQALWMESRGLFCEFNPPSPSAIEVLRLTTLAPQLYQRQLDLGGLLVQQGAEAEGRKFLGLKPTWRHRRGRASRQLRIRSKAALPMLADLYLSLPSLRTTKTGQWACLTTDSETLPIKARLIPPCPRLPITMSPAPISSPKATISLSGLPNLI
jgi:hypothetical protein